jgi:predicted DCC family thiol-disulfide oxidoreductase YuxK
MDDRHIIIFDGVCIFCNGAVNFIIKRDPLGRFVFTPMQSPAGQKLMEEYGATIVGIDTFLLVKDGQSFEHTDAALEIAKDLGGLWHWFRVLKVLPRPFRDYFYRLFARNRYKLFGRRESCMVPTASIRERFLN